MHLLQDFYCGTTNNSFLEGAKLRPSHMRRWKAIRAAYAANGVAASKDQIRRLGRWAADHLFKSYLTNLPQNALMALGGHETSNVQFSLPGGRIDPPDSLRRLIFPDLTPAIEIKGEPKNEIWLPRVFVTFWTFLRDVVLQDSVFLRDLVPGSNVWRHPVIHHQDYSSFAERVAEKWELATTPAPSDSIPRECLKDGEEVMKKVMIQLGFMKQDSDPSSVRLVEQDKKRIRVTTTIGGPNVATPKVVQHSEDTQTAIEGELPYVAKIVPQPPDGNCLFHSIAAGCGSIDHVNLRKATSSSIASNAHGTETGGRKERVAWALMWFTKVHPSPIVLLHKVNHYDLVELTMKAEILTRWSENEGESVQVEVIDIEMEDASRCQLPPPGLILHCITDHGDVRSQLQDAPETLLAVGERMRIVEHMDKFHQGWRRKDTSLKDYISRWRKVLTLQRELKVDIRGIR
ncbi:hypothetical protein BSKO_12514 [Bryopsis sp. KO-2023]|nr:hypothetical protein BSKO_12514 [Bryopsis sp. KO-2023]